MQDIQNFCSESSNPIIKGLVFEAGYLKFPGSDLPNNREEAIERLRHLGFIQGTGTFIAGAILDGKVEEVMPKVKMILQVGQNQFCGYAYPVYPLQQEKDLKGRVEKTFAGCEFQDDVFMIFEEV